MSWQSLKNKQIFFGDKEVAKAELKSAANEVRQKRLECEALLRSLASEDRYPTADELFHLQQFGLGNPEDLKREVSRLSRRISLEQQAGSAADREQMQQHVAQCEALLKSESPKLEKQISDCQRELSRLQKDARLASQRLEQMHTAASQLRHTLPESVKREYADKRNMIDSTLGKAVSDSEIRLNELRILLETPADRNSQQSRLWVEQWRLFHPPAFVDDGSGRGRWMVTSDFAKKCNEIRAEIEVLEPKLAQQRAEFEKAVAELDSEMEALANG